MNRFDWSLNSMIKILVIICLVAHLIVLQSTTQTIVFGNSPSQWDIPSKVPELWMHPQSSMEDQQQWQKQVMSRQLPTNISSSSDSSVSLGSFSSQRTINISAVFGNTPKPINALDLMIQYPKILLEDLIHTEPSPSCKKGRAGNSLFKSSTVLDPSITHPPGRKIPKIVHITTKTRCMPSVMHQNLDRWKFPDHNLYIHDDAAVERLLFETYWPEFPHLNLLRPCMISGAAMADLWRYLVLYEYGGIYTDMDAAPGPRFENASVISDHDEAWFVVERVGIPSQYFMASAPKHPLMHLLVTVTLRRLLEVQNVGEQYVPFVTGPGALKEAWKHFIHHYPEERDEQHGLTTTAQEVQLKNDTMGERRRLRQTSNERVNDSESVLPIVEEKRQEIEVEEPSDKPRKRPGLDSGIYVGMLNWTVTIAGNRGNTKQFINREAVKKKKNHWKAMGMRHFQHAKDSSLNMTCYERIYQMVGPAGSQNS
ncbi:glycosyltransferase sugar-binding protein containing DXD motif [Nitzschia inconspicua]|uniref:Glycosyltransferase sugar-binding protein containing DXD motif n=1 Tax=Nitzschia inconspicua TaxID=303405 RepID=A0A9K3LWX3_9STRA|nr:glycosyltransferase sugar-binding protein containing DXD motif [Nitzschia inconspicua]